MRRILILILSIVSLSLFGQTYNYKADIENINESRFYKIMLSPEVTSKLNGQFSDIRIYDTNSKEVPYILQKEQSYSERELFEEYKIIEKKHFKNGRYTRIVIHNSSKTAINNIVLRITNADVQKRLKLNGSFDNKNWYVLKDNYYYNSIYNSENSSEIRILDFPLSSYEYYELLIDDYYDKPINITQAGHYNLISENGKYSEIEGISYSIADTLKETVVSIATNGHYIDKISFDIESPRYFLRKADLILNSQNRIISSFQLVSNSRNTFLLNSVIADTLFVKIENNDNSPLKIAGVHIYELNKFLVAELEANNNYCLYFSDKTAVKPNYDLKYFVDSIPDNLKVIQTKSIRKLSNKEQVSISNNLSLKNYWLWISIVVVAMLLAYMSYKIIKENYSGIKD